MTPQQCGHPPDVEVCENPGAQWIPSTFKQLQVGGVNYDRSRDQVRRETGGGTAGDGESGSLFNCNFDVSDVFLFILLESSVLKPWSVEPVKESGRKVDPGSRVQRVLTESNCKVEKETVTFDEVKGEISYVVEGHDVERVTATLKDPHWHETHRRNIRDKLRLQDWLTDRRCQRRTVGNGEARDGD